MLTTTLFFGATGTIEVLDLATVPADAVLYCAACKRSVPRRRAITTDGFPVCPQCGEEPLQDGNLPLFGAKPEGTK